MEIEQRIRVKTPATVRLAMWGVRHRRLVVGLWLVITFGVFGLSLGLGGIKTQSLNSESAIAKADSTRADQIFQANNVAQPFEDFYVVITHPRLKYDALGYREVVAALTGKLNGLKTAAGQPVFAGMSEPYYAASKEAGLISPDGSSVRMAGRVVGDSAEVGRKLDAVKAQLAAFKSIGQDFEVHYLNNTLLNNDISELINADLDGSLKLTLPLTLLILLLVFGTLITALIPLGSALCSLVLAFGLVGLYSQVVAPINSYASQLIVLVGLAVSIDYSLFIIVRFRAERAAGQDKIVALRVATGTAGRAVFFSGLTVIISVAGLFLIGDTTFASIAVGTITVVFASIVGSLTFLPALLSLVDRRLEWGRLGWGQRRSGSEERPTRGVRLLRLMLKRPLGFGLTVAGLLLLLSYPVLGLRLGSTDLGSFPDKIDGVRAYNLLNQKWPDGTTLTLDLVITAAERLTTQTAIERLKTEIAQHVPGLSASPLATTSSNGKVLRLSYTMGGSRNDPSNQAIVQTLRQEIVPATFEGAEGIQVYVGGLAAYTADQTKVYTDAIPAVFGFVLGLSFIFLLVVFRSLAIACKAILLNLLSTGAAYGVLVLVFQEGWLADWLGIKTSSVIESGVPVFIFTILFGLSMDYHLFILSRIKEARAGGLSSNEAVVKGISTTSRTITSAAAIMVVVFAVFMTLQLTVIRQLGLGLAVAVFIDATLTRNILLPATMRLLGEWNWWLPSFLTGYRKLTLRLPVSRHRRPPLRSRQPKWYWSKAKSL